MRSIGAPSVPHLPDRSTTGDRATLHDAIFNLQEVGVDRVARLAAEHVLDNHVRPVLVDRRDCPSAVACAAYKRACAFLSMHANDRALRCGLHRSIARGGSLDINAVMVA